MDLIEIFHKMDESKPTLDGGVNISLSNINLYHNLITDLLNAHTSECVPLETKNYLDNSFTPEEKAYIHASLESARDLFDIRQLIPHLVMNLLKKTHMDITESYSQPLDSPISLVNPYNSNLELSFTVVLLITSIVKKSEVDFARNLLKNVTDQLKSVSIKDTMEESTSALPVNSSEDNFKRSKEIISKLFADLQESSVEEFDSSNEHVGQLTTVVDQFNLLSDVICVDPPPSTMKEEVMGLEIPSLLEMNKDQKKIANSTLFILVKEVVALTVELKSIVSCLYSAGTCNVTDVLVQNIREIKSLLRCGLMSLNLETAKSKLVSDSKIAKSKLVSNSEIAKRELVSDSEIAKSNLAFESKTAKSKFDSDRESEDGIDNELPPSQFRLNSINVVLHQLTPSLTENNKVLCQACNVSLYSNKFILKFHVGTRQHFDNILTHLKLRVIRARPTLAIFFRSSQNIENLIVKERIMFDHKCNDCYCGFCSIKMKFNYETLTKHIKSKSHGKYRNHPELVLRNIGKTSLKMFNKILVINKICQRDSEYICIPCSKSFDLHDDPCDILEHIFYSNHCDVLSKENITQQRVLMEQHSEFFSSFPLTESHIVEDKLFVNPVANFMFCGTCYRTLPFGQRSLAHVKTKEHLNKLQLNRIPKDYQHNSVQDDATSETSKISADFSTGNSHNGEFLSELSEASCQRGGSDVQQNTSYIANPSVSVSEITLKHDEGLVDTHNFGIKMETADVGEKIDKEQDSRSTYSLQFDLKQEVPSTNSLRFDSKQEVSSINDKVLDPQHGEIPSKCPPNLCETIVKGPLMKMNKIILHPSNSNQVYCISCYSFMDPVANELLEHIKSDAHIHELVNYTMGLQNIYLSKHVDVYRKDLFKLTQTNVFKDKILVEPDDKTVVCYTCMIYLAFSQESIDAHVNSDKHMQTLHSIVTGALPPSHVLESVHLSTSTSVLKEPKHPQVSNIKTPKLEEPRVSAEQWNLEKTNPALPSYVVRMPRGFFLCKACGISVTGQHCLNSHLTGKKHTALLKSFKQTENKIKNVNSDGKSTPNASATDPHIISVANKYYACLLCKTHKMLPNAVTHHIAGKKHVNSLHLYNSKHSGNNKQTQPMKDLSSNAESKTERADPLAETSNKAVLELSRISNSSNGNKACTICNLNYIDSGDLITHLDSRHHQIKSEMVALSKSNIFTSNMVVLTTNSLAKCIPCCLSFSHPKTVQDHIGGVTHKTKLEAYHNGASDKVKVIKKLPSTSETPKNLPSTSETSKSLPPTSETPKSLPPTSKTPKSLPPTSETPKSLPSTSETPKSLPPTSKTPKSLPSTSKTPKSLPSTSETPKSLPSTSETPKSHNNNPREVKAVSNVSASPQLPKEPQKPNKFKIPKTQDEISNLTVRECLPSRPFNQSQANKSNFTILDEKLPAVLAKEIMMLRNHAIEVSAEIRNVPAGDYPRSDTLCLKDVVNLVNISAIVRNFVNYRCVVCNIDIKSIPEGFHHLNNSLLHPLVMDGVRDLGSMNYYCMCCKVTMLGINTVVEHMKGSSHWRHMRI